MHPPLPTGLLILHGDRLELLAQAVCEWLGRHPLAPAAQLNPLFGPDPV